MSRIARSVASRALPLARNSLRTLASPRVATVDVRSFHVTRAVSAAKGNVPTRGIIPFNLADIGEGIAEVEVLQWFINAGDDIKAFDKICEVQSDKATVEITSRYEGRVVELCYDKGAMAKVGSPLIRIDVGGDVLPSRGGSVQEPSPPPAPAAAAAAPAAAAAAAPAAEGFTAGGNKVFAVPAVRRLAKEHNLDLAKITGTGKNGRVMKEDVLAYISNPGAAAPCPLRSGRQSEPVAGTVIEPPADVPVEDGDTVVPLRGFRRPMVKTMTMQGTIAHFGYCEEIEMDNIISLRNRMKVLPAMQGVKFSYMPLLIKTASLALAQFPQLNAKATPAMDALVYKVSHNIGVAMDTPNGLVVPNIKNVQNKSLKEIAIELNGLTEAARQGKVPPEALAGGTLTLSNIGVVGGTYASPVLMPGELCIVALGRLQRVPRFGPDDSIVPRTIMNISWSADHRFVDGASVASFTEAWKRLLESTDALLLSMK